MMRILILGLWLAVSTVQCSAQISGQYVEQDKRLATKVTISVPKIYLGELMQKLGAQSGLVLDANEADSAADVALCVHAKDTELVTLLNAIWSTISYKGAIWRIERSGASGQYAYRFVRPLAAQQFAQNVRHWIQQEFEDEAAILLTAFELPDKERNQLAKSDNRVARALRDENASGVQRLFFQSTRPPDRLKVLRGEQKVTIPVSALPASGRSLVQGLWKDFAGFRVDSSGNKTPIPEPGFVEFSASRRKGARLAPALFMMVEGIGGLAYLGGAPLETAARKDIAARWMLSGDARHSQNESRKTKIDSFPQSQSDPRHIFQKRLIQLGEITNTCIVARLASVTYADPGLPPSTSIGDFLRVTNEKVAQIQHKWRDDVLLISDPNWIYDDERPLAWKNVRLLRSMEAASGGSLSIEDLLIVAEKFTKDEIAAFYDEYRFMRAFLGFQPLFARIAQSKNLYQQISDSAGVPAAKYVAELSYIPAWTKLADVLRTNREPRIRLVSRPIERGRIISVEILGDNGEVLTRRGFISRYHDFWQ